MNDKEVVTVLTIAGSDSGGGAGIQADLKTFAAIGVHGASVITTITAQNTKGVFGIQPINVELIRRQIRVVVEDLNVKAAKTGMLYNDEVIEAVADELKKCSFPLVVDPVMVAKSGSPLLEEKAVKVLVEKLLPIAKIVTPNKFEAEKLANIKITDIEDAKKAAKKISVFGVEYVAVKGGHLSENLDEVFDVLYHDGEFKLFKHPRVESTNTHGTGCCFSAAIAGFIGVGLSVSEAVKEAGNLVYQAVKHGLKVGGGFGCVNPLARLYLEAEKLKVLTQLEEAFKLLSSDKRIIQLMPEVRINFVYALPRAEKIEEVAGFPGRLTWNGEKLTPVSPPKFGGSNHTGRVVLAAMRHYPFLRSAINIKYEPKIVEAAKKLGLRVSSFNRKAEPEHVKAVEGKSLSWGVEEALKNAGAPLDVVYDVGDVGKEPMIRILGENPFKVVEKVLGLLNMLNKV
ncbi:MAG: bifunctional hydroxymethylpyrimidine kinase/phosphomethylpyrimidine kinase [Candidatus Bathyarchaeota archaeon]|nr:bifunctional hydroxymethylpyrimidine kinase/phosphomethylpyrimidine kinase [Candidatus Bathyarchaeota archaeon]